jgi:ribulose bisphosphate carboxylase small subunit
MFGGDEVNTRSIEDVLKEIKECRKTARSLYIEKLGIKTKMIENNIRMTKLREEEEDLTNA